MDGTKTTATLNLPQPAKAAGWCDQHGVEHSWRDGPTLTMSPAIQTRWCINCGKRQFYQPGDWQDA